MATLAPNTRRDNIERSLNVYIDTEIKTGLSLKVIPPRSQRSGTLPDHWVEVAFFPLSAVSEIRRSFAGRRGAISQYLVNLNCFEQDKARERGTASLYTLTTLVDDVSSKFLPNVAVPVLDYNVGGTPVSGALTSVSFPAITEVPTVPDAGLTQVNISVTLHYVAEMID